MAKGRQTVTYQMAVDHYGQPLFEKLKKKIRFSSSEIRAKQDIEQAQKEIEKIDQELQKTIRDERKDELKVAREKIRQKLADTPATSDAGTRNVSEKDEKFFLYVKGVQDEYEKKYGDISEKEGSAIAARMGARGAMMERIVNKYIDDFPEEVYKVVEGANSASKGTDAEYRAMNAGGAVPDTYFKSVLFESGGAWNYLKSGGAGGGVATTVYSVVFKPGSGKMPGTSAAEVMGGGVEDSIVLGSNPNQPGATIFDTVDASGQLNIRKLPRTELIGGDVSAAEKPGAQGFGTGAADAHQRKQGYIPMYRDGKLVDVDKRPEMIATSMAAFGTDRDTTPVVMVLAGKNDKESAKLIAAFALRSAAAGYFFGSEDRGIAEDKLFANGDERATDGIPSATVGFDVDVSKTVQNVKGVSAEVAQAEKIEAMKEKLQKMAFREQCFLVDHFKPLIQYKITEANADGVNSYAPFFSAVDINPALFVARVAGQPSLQPLFEITSAEFSQLLPKIKLYKRFPGKDALKAYAGPAGVDNTNAIHSAMISAELKKAGNKKLGPNDMIEVEIPFHINPTTQTINEVYANDKPRADGVGLRSFTFDFIGRNSFEVERNIVCKMELFFRNLEDLKGGTALASFIDLILFGVSKKNSEANVNKFNQRVDWYHPDDYTMKAVVGWEVPPNSMLKHGLVKNKKLVALLKKNILSLILTLTNHKINFSQDGSGTVEIDFIGAFEAKSFSNNLLAAGTTTGGALEKLRTELRLVERKLAYRKARYESKGDEENIGAMHRGHDLVSLDDKRANIKKAYSRAVSTVNRLRTDINYLENSDSIKMYSRFFEELYDLPIYYVDIEEGESLGGVMDPDTVLGLVNNRMIADDKLAARVRMGANTDKETGTTTYSVPLVSNLRSKIKPVSLGDKVFQKGKEDLFEGNKSEGKGTDIVSQQTQQGNKLHLEEGPEGSEEPEGTEEKNWYKKTAQKVIDERKAKKGKSKQKRKEDFDKKIYIGDPTPSKTRRIYFTYIGSVLKAGFNLVAHNVLTDISSFGVGTKETAMAERDARFLANRYLFGTFPFYDVREEKPAIVNITDLPIALNKVNAFWFNTVVRKALTSYTLNEFIRDVINDLVIPFFSARCYASYPPALRIKSMYSVFEARGKGGRDRVPAKSRISNISEISKNPGFTFENPKVKVFNYNYVYVAGSETIHLGADVVQDADRGIYHFFIGLDRGLLKSAEFDRLDTAHQREMRSIGDENRISAQLRQPYKLNIKTFGNTLFRPGMFCYVNPRIAGGSVKRQKSLTHLMNLGGYANITKVSNVITPGSFETQIDCVLAGGTVGRSKKTGPIEVADLRSKAVFEETVKEQDFYKGGVSTEAAREIIISTETTITKLEAILQNPEYKEQHERAKKDLSRAREMRQAFLEGREAESYKKRGKEETKKKEKIKPVNNAAAQP